MKKVLLIGLAGLTLSGCGNESAQSEEVEAGESSVQMSTSVASEQESGPTEEAFTLSDKREVVFTAAENFLDVHLSFDTEEAADMVVRRERREDLEPYVTDELLAELEPTNEELEEKGWPIPTEEEEYDPTVSPVTNLMEYEYDLDDHDIFIDEESLGSDTVHVVADAFYTLETDMEGNREEYDEFRTYTFDVEEEDGEWVISSYEVIRDDCITAYEETDDAQRKRAGIVELDENGKVLSFEEKPEQPKSPYAVPAFYLYKKDTLPLFKQYLEEDNNPDAPGHFVPYLLQHKPVHAYLFEGKRYDIGTVESYERVKEIFNHRD